MQINRNKLFYRAITILFIVLILARDILGIGIPLIVLTCVWCLGLIIWKDEEKFAFTVSATICFASSVSITIPILFFLLIILFKYKKIYFSKFVVLSLIVIFIEGLKYFQFPDQNIKLYLNQCMMILLVAIALHFYLVLKVFKPEYLMKYYLTFFSVLSLDILVLTVKNYGSLSSILGSSFRIGQTDFVEGQGTSAMSINANGIGLLAIIAVVVAFVLYRYKHLSKVLSISMIIYASLIGFMTISKTFFLIYALVMGLLILENAKTNAKKPWKAMALILAVMVFFLVFKQTQIYENIERRFETGDLTTGRVDITFEYLNYMSEHPQNQLLGLGLQNINKKVGVANVPHNALLETYVTLGISGVFIFAILFLEIYVRSRKNFMNLYNKRLPFINIIPFITYIIFIQSLQFLRISYIYCSIIVVAVALMINVKAEKI